ncbi:uncharacterized protein LOC108434778 isoform X1 [Pygocentrus nattereri]|uniref:uncharacterized protein LOC108434778 isoform X1 n=1 Tax=Pygocentrus nattereri TaxID=42514 RepID=UPI001890F04D|nr:uncharacterized protein LOC108434778 isoform X1 [Pygocentrus nattereri]
MEDDGGFQTQFASVMESVLKAAVGEATKLFERTLRQLRAELVRLKQENVDLKTGAFAHQFKARLAAEGAQRTGQTAGPPRRDVGVQCEKPLLVERCCSPAPIGLQLPDIASDGLADLCSSAAEDGNRQLALLLIKKEPQETDCDDYAPGYFLLKQEGAEPILVRKEPFKNTVEKVTIPSTFQTVTRCYGNPRELSTASTSSTTNPAPTTNTVSCSNRVDYSNDKVTQTTSTSTFKGLASLSDTERQNTSASATISNLPELPGSSTQLSLPAVSLPAPAISLSRKQGQMSTPRANLTAPPVSSQTNQFSEPHVQLKTSQPLQIVQNIQHPGAVAGHPHHQHQNLDSCSSVQSLKTPVVTAKKRVLPALVDQTVRPVARSSAQAKQPSIPPVESFIPRVKSKTALGHFLGPRAQFPFPSDQCTAPVPLSQITSQSNPVPNPPVQDPLSIGQGPVQTIQGPLPPAQVPIQPIQSPLPLGQSPVPSIQGTLPPNQGPFLPVQGPLPPGQGPLPPGQGPLPPGQGPLPGQGPVLSVQGPLPTGQNPVLVVHTPLPHGQGPVLSVQGPVPPVQVPISPLKGAVPPIHVPVPPAHAPVPPTQSKDILPPQSQNLNLQGHFPSVPLHNLAPSSQSSYPSTHIPFTQSYIPVQTMKSSVSPVSIPQTNAPSSLEQMPVTTPHYLSGPLCSSTDQFFPPPDNASDLLQPLPPMPFHSPIVLTQLEAALEQPSMIHSQSSGQPLQLAPLLTPKEQQAAACNQGNVSKRGPTVPIEIPISTGSSFEEAIQRFPSCSSPTISCEGNESITMDMHDEDSTANDAGSSPALMPGMSEHFKVLSKPESNFRVLDSTKEQQPFKLNMMKGPQISNEVSKQNQTISGTIGQVWESADSSCALPHSGLSAPAPDVGRTVLKASRRVLEKNTECSECGRILSNASSLENHMRLHRGERPYNCSQCGKAFPSVRGLNRHVKVHAEEKGYKCEECGRSFVYQFTLTKHKLIHSGDRPFPCKICGKKFLAKTDRATHMRMHTGEKPFFCGQCGKTFKHRVALNMHVQGHRGEKRYVCPHCDKGFVDLGNFKRHKRIHTGEKPFECKECGKRFTQSAHLKKHLNTQHATSKPK